MRRLPEIAPQGGDEAMIPITDGEHDYVINRHNAFMRTFDEGDGQYNHCCFIDDEGEGHAFLPSVELIEQFARTGFPFYHQEKIDEATRQFFQGLDANDSEA